MAVAEAIILGPYHSLRTKECQFDNFVVTGGTVSFHYDNLRYHQSRQKLQIGDLLFSVLVSTDNDSVGDCVPVDEIYYSPVFK